MVAENIFGLNGEILHQGSAKERMQIQILTLGFCALTGAGFIAFFYFFFLVSQSYVIACIGSMLFGFVYKFEELKITCPARKVRFNL